MNLNPRNLSDIIVENRLNNYSTSHKIT